MYRFPSITNCLTIRNAFCEEILKKVQTVKRIKKNNIKSKEFFLFKVNKFEINRSGQMGVAHFEIKNLIIKKIVKIYVITDVSYEYKTE